VVDLFPQQQQEKQIHVPKANTPNLPSYELAYKANIEWVVFTCGSSQGRGPRCASWFLEHVREVAGDNDMQVLVLEGGVKGWVQGGPRFTSLMDGFKPELWEGLLAAEEKKAVGESEVAK
jgi:arsenical-resistance protein 2